MSAMKGKLKGMRTKFLKLFQKEKDGETLTLDRGMFDMFYHPSTNENSLSESLKCRLLPSSNFDSEDINGFSSPMSADFHTSPENKAFFEPQTENDSLVYQQNQHDLSTYTMDQLCSMIDDDILEIQCSSSKESQSSQRFLSNSSLSTITQIQNVKFNHNWGTLYNVNEYPSDSKQWSFYKTRASPADTRPPKLVKVIKSKNQY
ncbi:hypothetical protein CANMA_000509 [Candida margitis]|uniref:uncharacterized protein n=1 Tax=Candida margitis TaxID=1775924 RepID=UPI0022273FCF|nr:uncharacterized protein CANMA_000509 [Candida margitis]KAI5970458.1 hypothetical protein CANMA_000509 [Candida margitis]